MARCCASSTVACCPGVEKASRAKPCNFYLRLPSPAHGIPRTSTMFDGLLRGVGNFESPNNVFIAFPHKRHRLFVRNFKFVIEPCIPVTFAASSPTFPASGVGQGCLKSARGETHPLHMYYTCLLYTSPSPRDQRGSRMPSSA